MDAIGTRTSASWADALLDQCRCRCQFQARALRRLTGAAAGADLAAAFSFSAGVFFTTTAFTGLLTVLLTGGSLAAGFFVMILFVLFDLTGLVSLLALTVLASLTAASGNTFLLNNPACPTRLAL